METIFAATLGTYRDEGFYTHRHILDKSALLADATSVRVKFQYNGAFSWTIEEVYIGLRATSGNIYDIDPTTLVRLRQDGDTTFVITPSYNFSDPVGFVIDGTRDVIISFFGTGQPYTSWSVPSGCVRYYKYTNFASATAEPDFVTGPGVVGFLALEGESSITQLSGPIFVTEEVDDASASSYTWNVGKLGVEDLTDDVTALGYAEAIFADVAEYVDDVVASGYTPSIGVGAISEYVDETALVGSYPPTGAVIVAEEIDLVALTSFSGVTATECLVAVEEPLDKVVSVGVNAADRIVLTEGADDIGAAAVTWNAGFVTILEYRDEVTTYAASGETRGPLAVHEALDGAAVSAYTSNVGRVVTSCGVDGVAAATEETVQAGNAIMAVIDPVDLVAIQTTTCIGAVARLESPLDGVSLRAASAVYGTITLDDPVDQIKLLSFAAAGDIPLFEFTRPVADMDGDLPAPSPATVLRFNRPVPALGTLAKNTAVEPFHFSR